MTEKSFPKILAVQPVVMDEAGRVLLRPRKKQPDQGKWEVFGGYLEPEDVTLINAVKRELKEKAGITETGEIKFTGKYYDDPNRHPGLLCIPLVFTVKVKADVVRAPETKWFTPNELPALDFALDNRRTLEDLGLIWWS